MKFRKLIPVLLIFVVFQLKATDHSTGLYLLYGNTIQFKNHSSTIGVRWDWTINRSFSLGAEFNSFISDDFQSIGDYWSNEKPFYKLNFGGLVVTKYLLYEDNNRFAIGCLFGGGGLHKWNLSMKEYNLDNLIIFEPQILFEQNINSKFAFGIIPSFRYVSDKSELSHPSLKIYLKFGTY
jgi:hypothetical protein